MDFEGLIVVWGQRLLGALIVLGVGWWITRLVTGATRRAMARSNVDPTLTGFAGNLTRMGLLALVAIVALGQLGVNTMSFAAVLAAAGLAIGLALQGSLGNFASGVMLIALRPFKAGDYIEAAGTAGTVTEVHVFATTLTTPDNRVVIVPNGQITSGNIVNYSAKDTRRLDLVFGIGYGDDVVKARAVLQDIVTGDPRVLGDPAPTIAVLALGESSVDIAVRPWVKSGDYWPLAFDLKEKVKVEFDRQGISIPFPQRDVHLHQVA
jgi:small conductance mechanosensitive channel